MLWISLFAKKDFPIYPQMQHFFNLQTQFSSTFTTNLHYHANEEQSGISYIIFLLHEYLETTEVKNKASSALTVIVSQNKSTLLSKGDTQQWSTHNPVALEFQIELQFRNVGF